MPFSSADPANYFALALQTPNGAAGTYVESGYKFVKHLSGGLKIDQTSETVYEGGDGQDPGLIYKSKVSADAEIEVFARPDTFAYLSAWAMGTGNDVASPIAGLGVHYYRPAPVIPNLSLEQSWGGGNVIEGVSDAIITGLKIESEAGAPWKLTPKFLAGGTPYRRMAGSARSATLESGDPAMQAGAAVLVNNATSFDIRSWSWNFERKVDDDLYTNQVFRRAVLPLARSLELTFQMIFQNASWYNMIYYGGPGGSVLPADLATGRFDAYRDMSASQHVKINVPMVRFTGAEVNRLEPDGETVILDVTAQAQKLSGTILCGLGAAVLGVPTTYLLAP